MRTNIFSRDKSDWIFILSLISFFLHSSVLRSLFSFYTFLASFTILAACILRLARDSQHSPHLICKARNIHWLMKKNERMLEQPLF